VTTRSIDYDNFIFLVLEKVHTLFCDLDRVSLSLMPKEWALDFGCIHLELLEGTGTECISANQTHTPSLLHVVICELCASGGLTRPLKTDKHDNIRAALLELVRFVLNRLDHVGKFLNNRALDKFADIGNPIGCIV